jgi:hypothetical protein
VAVVSKAPREWGDKWRESEEEDRKKHSHRSAYFIDSDHEHKKNSISYRQLCSQPQDLQLP